MREIKFRAWHKKQGWLRSVRGMASGYHSENQMDDIAVVGKAESFTDSECILMQYIGEKDKNGKEIYEGDVIERHFVCAPDRKHIVTETQAGWNPFIDDMTTDKADRYEVIGNIHENPELKGELNGNR